MRTPPREAFPRAEEAGLSLAQEPRVRSGRNLPSLARFWCPRQGLEGGPLLHPGHSAVLPEAGERRVSRVLRWSLPLRVSVGLFGAPQSVRGSSGPVSPQSPRQAFKLPPSGGSSPLRCVCGKPGFGEDVLTGVESTACREERAVDCSPAMLEIEEYLQAAFKKLRVDAEGSTASLSVNEVTSLRPIVRITDETKLKNGGASKESWHCCLRKPLRGTVRTQRRRRSKSPILRPPKFIHCSNQTSSCSPSMSKNSTSPSESNPGPEVTAPQEFSKPEQASHLLNNPDPKQNNTEQSGASTVEMAKNKPEGGTISLSTSILKATGFTDFQSVSEQNKGSLCACTGKACQCQQWQDMKVYMFSDLQNSLPSAPERTTHVQDNSQVLLSKTPSGSLKSCSEQARANVDDVTIEDLSGYMEYFLHIPKKMSQMAEMMYT